MTATVRRKVDKVRASRDGHEFHEAWTARKAMQLLWPESELVAIAIEGLSPVDQIRATASTTEIADITLYFGDVAKFEDASTTIIAQFKYSVTNHSKDFRAKDAKKTLEKFGKAYRDYETRYGVRKVNDKLRFHLITNQPVYPALQQAIKNLATNAPSSGDVQKQAKQIQTACGLSGKPLTAFMNSLNIIGRTGGLRSTKNELASLLVDWSATADPIATARLGKLRDLVRERAGHAGTDRNLITRTDLLYALQIADSRDLLPCEARLTDVGRVIEREQFLDATKQANNSGTRPLLIHASGGVGKTVLMEALAEKLAANHEVVFFDCFGGGAYRSSEDSRHLPRRGLIHIANTLAFRGLCDPILPDTPDVQTLLRTFRRRLAQCVETMTRAAPGRTLFLLIDAIDNAVLAAKMRSEDCFPIQLLEGFHDEPITGVKLIVASRTERKPPTYAKYDELELLPFSKTETAVFLRARLNNVSQAEISVAHARSGGNPRVLDYLISSGRGPLDESEVDKTVELDDLIRRRIEEAIDEATRRGHQTKEVQSFVAGLAVLPPPVPLDEYAGAHGVDPSAIESFASDLYPLLERTNHGIMFRDEPTETLVHKQYASSSEALRLLASNLLARQETSVYAARALPALLHQLNDSEQLFALAFDTRIPASITSTVGKQNVRYARLKAATQLAARNEDYNWLVRLLVELSTLAAAGQRGATYLMDHPDLVVATGDVDATRRLFETRTGWPGTRHARLAIANTLAGDSDEAYRHARADDEWTEHNRRTRTDDRAHKAGPERPDIAAIPFFLLSQNRIRSAVSYLKGWRDWYAYEVCELVFAYSHLARVLGSQAPRSLQRFIRSLSDIGPIAAALSFQDLPHALRKDLSIKLARRCRRATQLQIPEYYRRSRTYELADGLRKSAAIALSVGLAPEALAISSRVPRARPRLWSFREVSSSREVLPFVFDVAIRAAVKADRVRERDLLPMELVPICARIRRELTGKQFRDEAIARLSKHFATRPKDNKETNHTDKLSVDDRQLAERFLNHRLQPLLALASAFSTTLSARLRCLDAPFHDVLVAWKDSSKSTDPYRTHKLDHFFRTLGRDLALCTLWFRSDLSPESFQYFLTVASKQQIDAESLIRAVAIASKREPLKELAGKTAKQARALIEEENEVSYRASLFGMLAQAILPASVDEASHYFRSGLEQMDAIGSGDYEFTSELLLFASRIRGEELSESTFHTLTNICELNMGDEPEKFPWGPFGRGLSNAAGIRALAKLSRWDDRAEIALDNTLLPYLTGLLEHGKINAKDAIVLNRLANPVEYFYAGTKEFAGAIRKRAEHAPAVVSELVRQFRDDNPNMASEDTVDTLEALASEALGASSRVTTHLSAARVRYADVRKVRNERNNPNTVLDPRRPRKADDHNRKNQKLLAKIVSSTDPTDETSLARAMEAFQTVNNAYSLKDEFFSALRERVHYNRRSEYLQNIAALENLFAYWKFEEVNQARRAWEGSSAGLADVFRTLGLRLVDMHAKDLVSDGRLHGSALKEISNFTGVPLADLVLQLIKKSVQQDGAIPGSLWLAFAANVCPEADAGLGQIALERLLASDAARMADGVGDGPWFDGRYPENDFAEIAAGMTWRVLGSPHATNRWRGAHTVRTLAKFGYWPVLDKMVARIDRLEAGAFQAEELPFYHMHARLWLLIALARTAADHPAGVSRYKETLLSHALGEEKPHVLIRHFAARALLVCAEAGHLTLEASQEEFLRIADKSAHPHLHKKIRNNGGFYDTRPPSAPEPSSEFYLDYDFHKLDVDGLARVFGQPCWKVADMISEIVHDVDPKVGSMHDLGGRGSQHQRSSPHMVTRYHTYGEQLGWHALFVAAGRLLAEYPVTDDSWYGPDSWAEWLGHHTLTRDDGLWLSDGTDCRPLDTSVFLLERKKNGLAITGDQVSILQLASLSGSRVDNEIVVRAGWSSADEVRVHISSALVPTHRADVLARRLAREQPMAAWLPCLEEADDGSEYTRGERADCVPWIVCPSREARLDEHDPYGASCAVCRPRLSRGFAALHSLSREDAFGRCWRDKSGQVALRVQAWGRQDQDGSNGPNHGTRMFCSASLLKETLTQSEKSLLMLIRLERYEKGSYREKSTWTHTVAVMVVTKTLDLKYFKGRVNYLHRSRF